MTKMISKTYYSIDVSNEYIDRLHGEEIFLPENLNNATLRRKCEFLAGRKCVRLAYNHLGIHNICDPKIGKFREPLWPPGIHGSITHNKENAAAIVSNDVGTYIGIDIENWLSIESINCLSKYFLTKNESVLVKNTDNKMIISTILFSAKESIYKCLFSIKALDFIPKSFNLIDWSKCNLKFSVKNNTEWQSVLYPKEIYVNYKLYENGVETLTIHNYV